MENIKSFEEFHEIEEAVTIENDMVKLEGFMKKFTNQLSQIKYMLGSDPKLDKKEVSNYIKELDKAENIVSKTIDNIHKDLEKKSNL